MELQGIELNEWANPRNGETRYYVNDLAGIIGLEVEYYQTGNIAGATLKGEYISNNKAARAVSGLKVWLTEDGEIHTQGASEYADEIVAAIKAAQEAAAKAKSQELLDWDAIEAATDPEFGVRIEKFLPATDNKDLQSWIMDEVHRHLDSDYEELVAQHYGQSQTPIYGAPII